VRIELAVPQEMVTVHLAQFDVDDPSSNPDPANKADAAAAQAALDDESKWLDNRSNFFSGGTLPLGSLLTDAKGVALLSLEALPSQPGDNLRVVASLDGPILSGSIVPGGYSFQRVKAKQNDGEQAGVYFTANGNAVPTAKARTVTSGLLTVWRHLTIERDHMDAPPAGEVFEAAEPAKDVNPGGPVSDVDLSHLITHYRKAYITVVDAGALNTFTSISWVHNWPSIQAYRDQMVILDACRDVESEPEFWAALILSAYEPMTTHDHDPPTAPPAGGVGDEYWWVGMSAWNVSTIFTEVIRDVATTGSVREWRWRVEFGEWRSSEVYPVRCDQDELTKRVAYHESVHQFGILHPGVGEPKEGPGEEGVMNYTTLFAGNAADIVLTPRQLAIIRSAVQPSIDQLPPP
jgi:hypothetical protein